MPCGGTCRRVVPAAGVHGAGFAGRGRPAAVLARPRRAGGRPRLSGVDAVGPQTGCPPRRHAGRRRAPSTAPLEHPRSRVRQSFALFQHEGARIRPPQGSHEGPPEGGRQRPEGGRMNDPPTPIGLQVLPLLQPKAARVAPRPQTARATTATSSSSETARATASRRASPAATAPATCHDRATPCATRTPPPWPASRRHDHRPRPTPLRRPDVEHRTTLPRPGPAARRPLPTAPVPPPAATA